MFYSVLIVLRYVSFHFVINQQVELWPGVGSFLLILCSEEYFTLSMLHCRRAVNVHLQSYLFTLSACGSPGSLQPHEPCMVACALLCVVCGFCKTLDSFRFCFQGILNKVSKPFSLNNKQSISKSFLGVLCDPCFWGECPWGIQSWGAGAISCYLLYLTFIWPVSFSSGFS